MTIDNQSGLSEDRAPGVPAADTTQYRRRKRRKEYDGSTPLEEWLEKVADFLATPRYIREIKTLSDLAVHLKVSRMTVYRWAHDEEVLTRARYLLEANETNGDHFARLYWDRIVMGQVRAAIKGDTRAAKFCEQRAWPKSEFSM